MGLHGDLKKKVVEVTVKRTGEDGGVWNESSHAYAAGTTADVVDYMTSFKALPTEFKYTLEKLATHMTRVYAPSTVITILAVDDKRCVPNLKAGEQKARVAASALVDKRKGLEEAEPYPPTTDFKKEESICLRRIARSCADTKRALWCALEPLYYTLMMKTPTMLSVFDWTTDGCMGRRRDVPDFASPVCDAEMLSHTLGEADLVLFYWAHEIFENRNNSIGHEILTVVLDTKDSDTLALAAFYLPKMPKGKSLHWRTGVAAAKDKSGQPSPAKKGSMASKQASPAYAAAAASASASASSGEKRKSPGADADDSPLMMDLEVALTSMCKEYGCDYTTLGQAMILGGHDFLATNKYAYFKGLPAILDAYFGAVRAISSLRPGAEPWVIPSLSLFRNFILYLWMVKGAPFLSIDELRMHYTKEHIRKVAIFTRELPALTRDYEVKMDAYRVKLAAYEALDKKTGARRPVEPKAPTEPILHFPTDEVIAECAYIWIFVCDYYDKAHLGVPPARTLAEIEADETRLTTRTAASFLSSSAAVSSSSSAAAAQ